MSAKQSTDVTFIPKVWNDHIQAYFDRKMALGQLAVMDKTLTAKPGTTVDFPFWKKISEAQEPAENEGLEVSPLLDGSFNVTVKEIGKAVGWSDKARRTSAASPDAEGNEAQRQLAQVFAEKVDSDIITEINTVGKFTTSLTGASYSLDKLTANKLLEHLILGFGDKHNQCVAHAMHSLHFLELMNNAPTGLLVKDTNDPFFEAPGYQGRFLGAALFTLDTIGAQTTVDSKKAFPIFSFKANPMGIYMAEDLKLEKDRDILMREDIVAATMWYGVLSLNAKVSSDDKRIIRSVLPTGQAA